MNHEPVCPECGEPATLVIDITVNGARVNRIGYVDRFPVTTHHYGCDLHPPKGPTP